MYGDPFAHEPRTAGEPRRWPRLHVPIKTGRFRNALGADLRSRDGLIRYALDAYDEPTFRYFLAVEARRYARSSRRFGLLLVSFDPQRLTNPEHDTSGSFRLFSSLSRCVRETDFIGWYEEGRVAAAVLTSISDTDADGSISHVAERVASTLQEEFGDSFARQLQVRAYHLPDQAGELKENRR